MESLHNNADRRLLLRLVSRFFGFTGPSPQPSPRSRGEGARRRPPALLVYVIFVGLSGAPARANDSIAETALGGLTLAKSDAISMDSEDLYVSRDRVEVKYRFTNTSDAPIEALVAFPLPVLPPGNEAGEDEAVYWGDARADLEFQTKVDGAPLPLQIVEQALFQGRDVSARLSALGVPLNRISKRFDAAINALPKAERDRLVAEKLIVSVGDGYWSGLWELHTTVMRRQTFPAKKTVTVEHRYKPLAGGAAGPSAESRLVDFFGDIRGKYCIEDDWLKSLTQRLPTMKKNTNASEIFLSYVLKTGANWKGPIKDFRLVIDKGKPDSLVSFCGEGVKKISPTRFEVRHLDLTPTKDLDVLIVDFPR
jgi:hypothetical protein